MLKNKKRKTRNMIYTNLFIYPLWPWPVDGDTPSLESQEFDPTFCLLVRIELYSQEKLESNTRPSQERG